MWAEAAIQRCSIEIDCNFIKKETMAQVFSCEFCEIFKNTFFYRTPLDDCFWSEHSANYNLWLFLKLGSHRGDKLHHPPSSRVINLVGIIEGSSPNFHRRRWLGWWISKSFDRPTTLTFFYIGKDVRIKYASNNFCLHLYYIE